MTAALRKRATAPAYPLPRPDDDPRFTLGLFLEVSEVLERHGYPPITAGADIIRLRQALFNFIYGRGETAMSVSRNTIHKRMRRSAQARRCPHCHRSAAMVDRPQDVGVLHICRWALDGLCPDRGELRIMNYLAR